MNIYVIDWSCPKCQTEGIIPVEPTDDSTEIRYRAQEAHAIKSEHCPGVAMTLFPMRPIETGLLA